jgi:hypothetical protein
MAKTKARQLKDTEKSAETVQSAETETRETTSEEQSTALTPEKLEVLRRMLDSAENSLHAVKKILFSTVLETKARSLPGEVVEGKVIEGVFDGENMIGKDGRKYPVPPNYASKSKLVPGDKLKLTISPDGTFIYKQIGPVERAKIIGTLEEDDGKFKVFAEGKYYNVLLASVTYFKAKPGDKLTIIVPKDQESDWAAVENLITSA